MSETTRAFVVQSLHIILRLKYVSILSFFLLPFCLKYQQKNMQRNVDFVRGSHSLFIFKFFNI